MEDHTETPKLNDLIAVRLKEVVDQEVAWAVTKKVTSLDLENSVIKIMEEYVPRLEERILQAVARYDLTVRQKKWYVKLWSSMTWCLKA